MNQLSCAVAVCSSLRRRHDGGEGEGLLVALPRRLSRAFGKRQACKRDEVRLPSR